MKQINKILIKKNKSIYLVKKKKKEELSSIY